ncbi:MAG: hypothetical protein IKC49_03860 [Clostridia bacterium]|nr:hypothetical protein [Clostridia bacterium]
MAMLKEGLDLNIDEWFPNLDKELPLTKGVKTKNLRARQDFAYDHFQKFYCRYVNIHNSDKFLFMKKEFYTLENVNRILEYMYYAEKVIRRNVREQESLIMRSYLKHFYESRMECIRRLLKKHLKEREKELRKMARLEAKSI